jgi:L-alanine-DL-glutamate epimerase-like enolase superfamily enzyme
MDAAQLKSKIELAKAEVLRAQQEMDRALQQVEHAERSDKVMISSLLVTALAALEAATHELRGLQSQLSA